MRPFYAWYGDMDLVGHAAELIGLGRLTVTVSFHEPVTIEQFASRKELTDHCYERVVAGHSDALAGRIQPVAERRAAGTGFAGGCARACATAGVCAAPPRDLQARARSAPDAGLTQNRQRLRCEIVSQ